MDAISNICHFLRVKNRVKQGGIRFQRSSSLYVSDMTCLQARLCGLLTDFFPAQIACRVETKYAEYSSSSRRTPSSFYLFHSFSLRFIQCASLAEFWRPIFFNFGFGGLRGLKFDFRVACPNGFLTMRIESYLGLVICPFTLRRVSARCSVWLTELLQDGQLT